jgi:hypothetical protein
MVGVGVDPEAPGPDSLFRVSLGGEGQDFVESDRVSLAFPPFGLAATAGEKLDRLVALEVELYLSAVLCMTLWTIHRRPPRLNLLGIV